MPSDRRLGIILLSGSHDRAHFAFLLAASSAALGREVVLFASNAGCLALCDDWSGLADYARDALVETRGVAGIGTLRDSCAEMDVTMIVCEAGMLAEGINEARLMPGVQVSGIATFLELVGAGQIVTI